jgi:hypothetical protein
MQPEGGENWVLGVVRRYIKDAEGRASVGIQSLSRHAQSVDLRPRSAGFSATGAIPGIWLRDGDAPGEARMVMPAGSFDVRVNLEFAYGRQQYILIPIELEKIGANLEIGRYRQQAGN